MNWVCKLNNDVRAITTISNPTNEQIADYCDLFIRELRYLLKIAGRISEMLVGYIIETKEHFDFCKDFATGEIKKEEYADYDFDGNLKNLFNDYVKEFWEICDFQIGRGTKFCFVNF